MNRRRPKRRPSGCDPRSRWHDLLRANLEIGVATDGHHFVWLEGLGLYGVGETFEEARRHLLRQFEEAIDERLEISNGPAEEPSACIGGLEAQTLEQTVTVLGRVIIERNGLRESLRLVGNLCDRSGVDCETRLALAREVVAKAIG